MFVPINVVHVPNYHCKWAKQHLDCKCFRMYCFLFFVFCFPSSILASFYWWSKRKSEGQILKRFWSSFCKCDCVIVKQDYLDLISLFIRLGTHNSNSKRCTCSPELLILNKHVAYFHSQFQWKNHRPTLEISHLQTALLLFIIYGFRAMCTCNLIILHIN